MKYYKLGDSVPQDQRIALGGPKFSTRVHCTWKDPELGQLQIMAKRTCEFRAPKKGEWYLSGAIPVAYRAPNNLSMEFHIMRLVIVKRVTMEIEVKV